MFVLIIAGIFSIINKNSATPIPRTSVKTYVYYIIAGVGLPMGDGCLYEERDCT
jgi:hypothetical protein